MVYSSKDDFESLWFLYRAEAFTEISKSVTSNTDKRFKALFAAIRDNQEVSALRNVLRYLSDKKYNADLEQLKRLMSKS